MVKFICFGSGSSGNCYYLIAEDFGIIIDLGIGLRSLKKHFGDFGLTMDKIKAILVTHDHTDHVKSVGQMSQDFHLPVYSSEAVHKGMGRNYFMKKKIAPDLRKFLSVGHPVQLGPFEVTSFPIPHDSAGNNGFFITYKDIRFCLITDAGHVTEEMTGYIKQSDYLVIEANYDEAMLTIGPYPPYLKRRIASPKGHMCNSETARILAENLPETTKYVWLCHLSEENNHPELARKTVEGVLMQAGYPLGKTLKLEVLKRKVPSPLYELT